MNLQNEVPTLAPAAPRVSILMPVHNVAPYIEEAIASIQAQTFTDFEFIIVNDGSTDATVQIAERLASSDPRIRILGTPVKSGISKALNLGLTECRGRYIARMDGDDISLPDRLEKEVFFLDAHPEIALVSSAITTINEYGNPLGNSTVAITHDVILKTMLLNTPCIHIWVARRELYESLAGYRDLPSAEDYDFLLRAISAGYRLHNLPEPLYRVRIRVGNTAHTNGIKQYLMHYYVGKLYKERVSAGIDSFSPAGLRKALHAGRMKSNLHSQSIRFLNRARSSRTMAGRYFWGTLSALVSPWQARLFLNRARYKYIFSRQSSK